MFPYGGFVFSFCSEWFRRDDWRKIDGYLDVISSGRGMDLDQEFASWFEAEDLRWDMPTSLVRVFHACNSSGLSSTILKLSVVTPGTCAQIKQ